MSATTRCAELGITLPPVAAPVADYVPAIQTGRYCFQSFVRVLCRSWPDEERQETLFERSPDEATVWYDILTRIQQHVNRVEHRGLVASPFIPVPERRLLEYALVLAQRKMATGEAS